MFNLVGKRYLFLLISLIIIVPGTISLLVKGLNVGIDFAGGATVEMRPSNDISVTDMKNLLKPLNLVNLDVQTGDNTTLKENQVMWVRLNTQIDDNVQANITNTLKSKYGSQTAVLFNDLALAKKITVVTITFVQGTTIPSTSDIQTLLSKLPNTTDPSKPATSSTPVATATPTANATATPRATSTPKARATAQPKATKTPTVGKGTPTAVASPTATATPVANPANIPVNVIDVQSGTTTHTITILTSSEVNSDRLVTLQTAIFKAKNAYSYVITNSSVSPAVASETTLRAFLAVLAASVFILLYVWFSFRKVAKPWRYGACAIIALLHDVLVVLGVFSILGWTLNIQIDTLFITAVLTVVGFSVHDTIVVFDRIRENMQRRTSETFDQVVNASLVQTMARSLNTSLTVLFTLTALTLFGGVTIRVFTLALLVGIFSGTYSSIFNASMLLVIWEKGELGLSRLSRSRTPDGREARELVRSR
jgi:preprotein translocase SecF subunit